MMRLSSIRWRVLIHIHNEDLSDYQGSTLAMPLCRHSEEPPFHFNLIQICVTLCWNRHPRSLCTFGGLACTEFTVTRQIVGSSGTWTKA
jgi:hypothetical protein